MLQSYFTGIRESNDWSNVSKTALLHIYIYIYIYIYVCIIPLGTPDNVHISLDVLPVSIDAATKQIQDKVYLILCYLSGWTYSVASRIITAARAEHSHPYACKWPSP